ncbi:succinyl-diaminopimelate desuccinylase [Desulfurispira natronophila]|uniref:Succinyl-diaminopimelate desuccinylase n=1 Tax=Desulfurispira natronophila TaxID=682562 RepID=A0A7W7Y5I8_9BACT|nr:succinyl-diaminopimelate desuccinylase [Desulfurispira natronophila]
MNHQRTVQILSQLLAIPSVTTQEQAIADWVMRFCLRCLPPSSVHRHGNGIIVCQPSTGTPEGTVVLAGHLDTVECPNAFHGQVRHGRLYGLGASDMKVGLAVMLNLLETWGAQWSGRWNLVHIFYDREEGPYLDNGLDPLLKEYGHLIADADLAICLEPTDNSVQVGCLGTMHAAVTFQGARAHSARPWFGENAIYKALPYLEALSKRAPVDHTFGELTYREVMNATTTTTVNTKNTVPGEFELNVNYRFAPGKSIEQACRELEELAYSHGAHSVEYRDQAPSGSVQLEAAALQALIAASACPPQAKQAWTDVARFSLLGLPAANFGPGLAEMAHKQDEYVELDMMAEYEQMLLSYLQGS